MQKQCFMRYTPRYKITPKIINLVAQVSEAVGGLLSMPEDLHQHRANRIRAIQGTLAIDGYIFSTEQIAAALDCKTTPPVTELQAACNAIKAYELLDTINPYNVEDLLKAHTIMETGAIDDLACFRQCGSDITDKKHTFRYAPPAEKVPYLMHDLFMWLTTTDEHPLIASCIFHHEFDIIRPFATGNGRMGRLWQTLILSRWRELFKSIPIESAFYAHQQEYRWVATLSQGADGCTLFIEFVLEVLAEIISPRQQSSLSTQEKILHTLWHNPRATRQELSKIVGISADGVKYHIQKLSRDGVIRRTGTTRNGEWEILR